MIVLENDETGAQTENHQKRMMGEIAKLTAGSNGALDVAAAERTVATLLAGGSDPVITAAPTGRLDQHDHRQGAGAVSNGLRKATDGRGGQPLRPFRISLPRPADIRPSKGAGRVRLAGWIIAGTGVCRHGLAGLARRHGRAHGPPFRHGRPAGGGVLYCLAVAERGAELTQGRAAPWLEAHLDEHVLFWRLRTGGLFAVGGRRWRATRPAPVSTKGPGCILALEDCATPRHRALRAPLRLAGIGGPQAL